ncbi:MAG: hypothetical protein ABI183_12685 [Polyangiaceae bacterium]
MYGDPRPLFLVTVTVIAGLVLWVAFVLLRMREPWRRNTALAVDPAAPAVQAATLDPAERLADEKPADEKAESVGDEKVADEPQVDKPKND